ncbi:MAG: hypothetical protein WB780_17570 [Candidatus Acidiferrales bacterium]
MKVFYELNLKVRVPVLPEDAECEAILSAIENDDQLQLAITILETRLISIIPKAWNAIVEEA